MNASELYTPLPHTKLSPLATYASPQKSRYKRVSLANPALDVMTDLRRVNAITIDPSADIAFVNQRMIAAAVRLLLVVDNDHHIVGLITASDILSERPLQFAQRHNIAVNDVTVADIMSPQEDLEVLRMEDVASAHVGDIVETLMRHGRQHALVVEYSHGASTQQVRGIFSATQIGRQLGQTISPTLVATTFAELEAALISSRKPKVAATVAAREFV